MTTKRKPDWADKTADRLNLIESSKGALKLVCGFDARMASALRAAYMRGVREEREMCADIVENATIPNVVLAALIRARKGAKR